MKTKIVSLIVCFAFVLASAGCSTVMEEHKGAAVGAGAGAAAGGIMGAIIGKGVGAVVVGSLIGALLGGAIGHFAYDQTRTKEQTAKTYNYKPSQGRVLTIENALASPATVRPGDTVDLKMTYAVLNPSENAKTKITEIREITYQGDLVGKPEVTVEQTDGTYTTTVPLRLPSNAAKGTYRVKMMVQSDSAKDTRETTFTVQ
jgi:FtsP/CotA-like multicopper oxidase with cupredoxin domain